MRIQFSTRSFSSIGVLLLAIGVGGMARGDQTKANNTAPLNTGPSWVSGVVPGAGDVAIFDSTLTLNPNANSPLGGDLTLAGIRVAGPLLGQANNQNGIIISNAGSANTLTLGASGIDMGAADAVPLQIQSKVLLTANQTWNVSDASSRITNPAGTLGTGQTGNTRYNAFGQSHDEDLLFFNQNATAGVSTIDLGGFTLNKTGNGTVEINAGYLITNGTINLNEGVLTIQGGSMRNTTVEPSVTINVAFGTTFRLQSNNTANTLINSTINLAEGSRINISTSNSTANRVRIGGTINVNGSSIIHLSNQEITGNSSATPNQPHEIAGNIAGSAPLSLRHTHTNTNSMLQLSGDNSGYSGVVSLDATAGRGIVRLSSNTAGSAAANWFINVSNTLDVAGNIGVQLGTLGGQGSVSNSTAGTTSTINVGAGDFAGALTDGLTGGKLALHKVGPGTLILSGGNQYTGGTTVSGGILRAAGSTPFGDMTGTVTVNTGGTIDLNGQTVFAGTLAGAAGGIITNDLAGSAPTLNTGNATDSSFSGTIRDGTGGGTIALAKFGAGQITLGGANTYSGNTDINEGALAVNGSLAAGGTVNVNATGRLAGTGTVGHVTLNTGSSIRPGPSAADLNVGTLTLASLTVNGGELRLDLPNPSSSDRVVVLGTANFAGPSTIIPTITPLPGTYTLLAAAELTGTAPTLTTPGAGTTRSTFTLDFDTTADQIKLLVTGSPKTLTWTGANGSAWDVATTMNWSDNGGATTNERFFNLDTVSFGNGPANRNVTLNDPVTPSAVTVNNAAGNDYTISGSGGIGDAGIPGGTPLTKSGAGTLTLGTTNTYLGPTTIAGGTLRQATFGAIPTGTNMTIGSDAGSATLDLGGFDVTVSGLNSGGTSAANVIGNSSTSQNATLTVNGGTNVFNGAIRDTLGAGNQKVALVASGGSLALTGVSTYSGGTTISGAAVRLGAASSLGEAGGALNMTANGSLDLGGNNLTAGAFSGEAGTSITSGVAGPVTVSAGDATDSIFAGAIANGSGTLSFVKTGTGTLTLSGANSHSGGSTVSAGALRLTNAAAPGTGPVTANNGTTLVVGAPLTVPITISGATIGGVGLGTNPFTTQDFTVTGPAATTLYIADPQNLGTNSEMILTGTLKGAGNINVLAGTNNASPDGGPGFRLRGAAASDYAGTITLGNSVKGEVQTTVAGPFSPAGTGRFVMTGGTISGTRQGTYSELNLRNNTGATGGNTVFGNDLEVAGAGLVVINMLGNAPVNSVSTMGNLKIGEGQQLGVNQNAAPSFTAEFTSATLTGGNAQFAPNTPNSGFTASSDLILGAIGQSAPNSGIIMNGLATLTLRDVNTYTGPTAVESGTLRVTGSVASSSGVTVNAGTFNAAASQTVKNLTVNPGAAATVTAGVLKVGDNTGTSPLTLNGNLDLTTRGLIVDHSPAADPAAALAAVREKVLTGYAGGTWTGSGGITSAAAAANSSSSGVGYASASALGVNEFMGTGVDSSAVLARYTLLGDATLDGSVNFDDLAKLAQNYNVTDGARQWFEGDFTYDGNVNFDDLAKLAQNYNTALPAALPGSAQFQEDVARAFANVPEPSMGLVVCGTALALLRRGRRGRAA